MKIAQTIGLLVILGLLLISRDPCCAQSRAPLPSADPFEWAWAFACAISTNDLVDQAVAQEKVIRDLLAAGHLDRARQWAPAIPNWRRGVVWADIAGKLAEAGRTNEARQALEDANLVRLSYRGGWQSDRIAAHMAMAYAALGESSLHAAMGSNLPPEESVKTLVVRANHLIKTGQFVDAQKILTPLVASTDFDVLTVVLDGFLQILHNPGLTDAGDRQWILTGLREVLGKVPFLRRMDVMHRVGDALGVEYLREYETALRSASGPVRYRAPALARLGRTWLERGERDRGRVLLELARQTALSGDPMDQPSACADVAVELAAGGDAAGAAALCEAGLEVAAGFVNARPRALALADLCRSFGRQRTPLTPAQQQQLAQLLDGLTDPW